MSDQDLEKLFDPDSVAIVGASTTPGKVGSRVVENLLGRGYEGRLYPINPRGGEIAGVEVIPSISELPEPVDVAYVLVPADSAVEATRELAEQGAKFAIVAAAEFAEAATDRGRAREEALREISRSTGIRIVGPNCNGIYSSPHHLSVGFNSAHGITHRSGGVTVLSHSGALFSTIALRGAVAGMGLSAFVSVGNECDLDILDYMEHFVTDPDTRVISLLLDSITDGARFRRLVDAARENGKSVVALKLGTSAVGASAAVAHSSRLAGSAKAYTAFFAEAGVGVVNTIEEFVAASTLLDSDDPDLAEMGLGVATMSGGAGTIVADAASRHGIRVPKLSEQTRARITELSPDGQMENPIDLGGVYGAIDIPTMFELLGEDEGISVVLAYYHPMQSEAERRSFAEVVSRSRAHSQKPHVLLAPAGVTDTEREILDAAGVIVMSDTETTMAALAAASSSRAPVDERIVVDDPAGPLPDQAALGDVTSIRLLSEAGIPMVGMTDTTSPEETVAAAQAAAGPVVLKGMLPDVSHKSDLGLVVVGIRGDSEVRAEAVRLFGLGATSVLVQPLVEGDVEALLGVVTEPGLGKFVVFGLGGVFTEAIDDVAMVPIDSHPNHIRTAVLGTKLGSVLTSPRLNSDSQAPLERFVTVAADLARWAASVGEDLEAIDINPLLITDTEVVGVDGLVVPASHRSALVAG